MSCEHEPRPAGLTRRSFIALASGAVGLWLRPAWASAPGGRRSAGDASARSALEREHRPVLRVPGFTINGAKVPIVVEMSHPMTAEHHITSVEVVNEDDPIPLKGTFHFTPGNGEVYVAFQARMNGGISDVSVTAECNRHGAFTVRRRIEIPPDAGGCAGTAPAAASPASGGDVRGPVLRIRELVERGRIQRDEVVHAQIKMRHPNRTGLVFRDGRFVQESEPLHLEELEVIYAGERVSHFSMTPALADDPFITFALRARREGPLRVVVLNSRGQKFEATHDIRFS
jgi:desulfoferrodoxin (superoxide reductase-like protein)